MKVILVQLSDIHFRSEVDPILGRVEQISKAIIGLNFEVDVCILVLSGDVAFSGAETEYLIACDFFQSIIKSLNEKYGADFPVHCVTIPGNHDCDFSETRAARKLIIEGLDKKQNEIDKDVVDICIEVQKKFFDFREAIENERVERTLAWEKQISTKDGMILFRCYNTSWLSQLHETPGSLFFPIGLASWKYSEAEVVISVLHHPYNWFDPDNARALRTHVERTSDIILTGHEHNQERRAQKKDTGEFNEYIEGGVLQESGEPSNSSFNILIIDTASKQQKYFSYFWSEDIYRHRGIEQQWEDYQVNRLRKGNRFAVKDSFQNFLQDPGLRLEHPIKGVLRLIDIFIYPDLREINDRSKGVKDKTIQGQELFSECRADNLLILGADQSGKTSLAKALFWEYHKQGLAPLFVDGKKFHNARPDRLLDRITSEIFGEQYDVSNAEYYRQIDRNKRVIIIDNFHALRFRRKEEEAFLDLMEKFAGKLVFLANDLAQRINQIVEGGIVLERRQRYRQLRILPFGHVRRNALIEQWCLLDSTLGNEEEALAKKVIFMERLMDTVIGKNFVPPYPVFLLAMLQAQEGTTPFNTNAGTYGYFYELLIRNSLAHGSDRVQLDIKLGYLAYLAFETYKASNYTFSASELQRVHERYQNRYAFRLNYQALRQELIDHGILECIEDDHRFKYKYIYYYFVASFLRDHITDDTIREEIAKLSSRLDDEDSANILLFLAHLSKDPFIISQMLDKAAKQYAEFDPAKLAEDTGFLRLDGKYIASQYIERDVTTTRRERLEQLDRIAKAEREQTPSSEASESNDPFEFLLRLTSAFRTMQILGQLLKNFVGTLERAQKQQISRECYSLGLRVLSSILRILESNKIQLVQDLVKAFREVHSNLSDHELIQMATESIFDIAHMISYSIIRAISKAVGSRDLEEIYDAIRDEIKSPAVELIHVSLKLDQLGLFPQGDIALIGERLEKLPLPVSVLRQLVINHFYLYKVHFKVKQSVCSKLGISYKGLQSLNPVNRLLIGQPQRSNEIKD